MGPENREEVKIIRNSIVKNETLICFFLYALFVLCGEKQFSKVGKNLQTP